MIQFSCAGDKVREGIFEDVESENIEGSKSKESTSPEVFQESNNVLEEEQQELTELSFQIYSNDEDGMQGESYLSFDKEVLDKKDEVDGIFRKSKLIKVRLPYKDGDLIFGLNRVRTSFKEALESKREMTSSSGKELCVIDRYNLHLGIYGDKITNLGDLERVFLGLKDKKAFDSKVESFKELLNEKEQSRLKKWENYLTSNLDILDIRNLSSQSDEYLWAKFLKNFPTRSSTELLLLEQNKVKILDCFRKWSSGELPYNKIKKDYAEFMLSFSTNYFFRKTSKLGLDFAKENGLKVHFLLGRNDNELGVLNIMEQELKEVTLFPFKRITCSEVKHCFRKKYYKEEFLSLLPYAITTGSTSDLKLINKKDLKPFVKEYKNYHKAR